MGVSREQAEAHVQIIAEIIEVDLATKSDLRELEYRLIIKLSVVMGGMFSIAIGLIAVIIRGK